MGMTVWCEVDADEEKKKGTNKTRKRVIFDMNVQTFVPTLPSRCETYCSDEEEGQGEVSNVSSVIDEDELSYEESDLEDEDCYTDDENN
ncbi:hypothetical protein F2Q70_00010673 [Brassica cretica]|uniref:Uncharacterized protein n=2 Tax=Brassica cretica TaxID=69181 RepID=A0A8S9J9A1_BRACR|nr:hypothetical protein F2Q68_00001340 [Brassica cretica]KAF2615366.1 hypothetical protein F2Q70_00010673 [Brassica cretica]KAF3550148.1 hypothetical protein DY000_02001768 [Brassica cretica]